VFIINKHSANMVQILSNYQFTTHKPN